MHNSTNPTNYPDSVTYYDTRRGNEEGLFSQCWASHRAAFNIDKKEI